MEERWIDATGRPPIQDAVVMIENERIKRGRKKATNSDS